MRRQVAGIAAGLLLLVGNMLVGSVPPAFAADTWCDVDPAVVLTTPAGNLVVVYVVDGGPIEHTASLLAPRITATTQPVQGGTATKVTLDVVVPNDLLGSHYAVTSQVWSGPVQLGTLYDSQSGFAGQAVQLHFTLNVP